MDINNGLRLTTQRIRSKGSSKRTVDLKKQLTNSFKLSVVNAKKRTNKQKKSEKTLNLALSILEKCEVVLKPLDYDDLKTSIYDLEKTYQNVITNSLYVGIEHEEEEEEEKDDYITPISNKVVQKGKKKQDPLKRKTARATAKKTLSKSQASFKKKLDRLTETIRIVESSKKMIDSLRNRIAKNEERTMAFKKHLCVELKANFDPLFGGAIGYENCARTDPYGDNLSKSVWDSKTSKPS